MQKKILRNRIASVSFGNIKLEVITRYSGRYFQQTFEKTSLNFSRKAKHTNPRSPPYMAVTLQRVDDSVMRSKEWFSTYVMC